MTKAHPGLRPHPRDPTGQGTVGDGHKLLHGRWGGGAGREGDRQQRLLPGPVLSAEGSSAHRCFWAMLLLLALAVLLLAGVMHVDVRLLMP